MKSPISDSTQTTDKKFEVRILRPEDADGVISLFRSVHGEDYPIKLFYDRDRLVEANEQGDYRSVIARTTAGKIIGIHNLFRSAPSSDVYEWGVGLVDKGWRGEGVSSKIQKFINEKLVPKLDAHTIFGEPVTNHVLMQKAGEDYGFTVTALEVGLMPGEAYSGEGVTTSRVSACLFFKLKRVISQKIYLPAPYQDILRTIYEGFSDGREFYESTARIPLEIHTESKMDIFDFAQVARIALYEIGIDFEQKIMELESEALKQGCVVIQAWIKLTCPWIAEAVRVLREKGFFFGGILPQWFDDDGFFMQKIMFEPDFESMRLYSYKTRMIWDYVRADFLSQRNS
ncbi:MAG: hypothetical protein AB7V04_00305 [Desulfomonilaceae bacterium]